MWAGPHIYISGQTPLLPYPTPHRCLAFLIRPPRPVILNLKKSHPASCPGLSLDSSSTPLFMSNPSQKRPGNTVVSDLQKKIQHLAMSRHLSSYLCSKPLAPPAGHRKWPPTWTCFCSGLNLQSVCSQHRTRDIGSWSNSGHVPVRVPISSEPEANPFRRPPSPTALTSLPAPLPPSALLQLHWPPSSSWDIST